MRMVYSAHSTSARALGIYTHRLCEYKLTHLVEAAQTIHAHMSISLRNQVEQRLAGRHFFGQQSRMITNLPVSQPRHLNTCAS